METQQAASLRVVDQFITVQGTGHLVGVPQYFVRLAGCSVYECPIRSVCDEPAALKPSAGDLVHPDDIALEARRQMGAGGWIHITGGEPFDQLDPLSELGIASDRLHLKTHYQTSGTKKVDLPWDWITVSPKCDPDKLEVTFGQEMVLVDRGQTIEQLREYYRRTKFWFYYLQPQWGQDPKDTIERVELLNKCGMKWSFTDQMHKRWGVM